MKLKKYKKGLIIGFLFGAISTLLSYFALGLIIFMPFVLIALPARIILQSFAQSMPLGISLFLMAIINGLIYSIIGGFIQFIFKKK
jgi:hypothetical protein